MDNIRALTIAIGCVRSSGMDSKTKNEVISEIANVLELIEQNKESRTHGFSVGDLIRVTRLDMFDEIMELEVGEIATITNFHGDGSGVKVFFEDSIGHYSLSFGQFEKVEVD